MTTTVLCSTPRPGLAEIRFNRPHRLNAVIEPLFRETLDALGAGAEMAINADFVLMAQSAQIGFPEASIGTFIGGGLTRVLPQLVGLVKARELVFLGERIDGREAKVIGLAAAAFPDATFRDDVYAFAERLAAQAPLSIALAKEQLNHGSERTYHRDQGDGLTALRGKLQDGQRRRSRQRMRVASGRRAATSSRTTQKRATDGSRRSPRRVINVSGTG